MTATYLATAACVDHVVGSFLWNYLHRRCLFLIHVQYFSSFWFIISSSDTRLETDSSARSLQEVIPAEWEPQWLFCNNTGTKKVHVDVVLEFKHNFCTSITYFPSISSAFLLWLCLKMDLLLLLLCSGSWSWECSFLSYLCLRCRVMWLGLLFFFLLSAFSILCHSFNLFPCLKDTSLHSSYFPLP